MTFKEVAPMVYESASRDRLRFIRNTEGDLTALIDFPFFSFARVTRPQDHKLVNIVVVAGSLAIMLLVLLAWPIAALVRRRYGRRLDLSRRDRTLRIASRAALAWHLLSLLALVFLAVNASETLGKLNSDVTTSLRAIQIMFYVGLIGTVVVGLNAARAWLSPGRGWVARVAESSALLATLGFSWILFNWNLLRFDLRF
jgi:hypothetical protein